MTYILPLRFQVLASVKHKIEQFAVAEQNFPLLLAEAQQYLLARMGSSSRELSDVLTKGNKRFTCKQIGSLNELIENMIGDIKIYGISFHYNLCIKWDAQCLFFSYVSNENDDFYT